MDKEDLIASAKQYYNDWAENDGDRSIEEMMADFAAEHARNKYPETGIGYTDSQVRELLAKQRQICADRAVIDYAEPDKLALLTMAPEPEDFLCGNVVGSKLEAQNDILCKAWQAGALNNDWLNKWIEDVYAAQGGENIALRGSENELHALNFGIWLSKYFQPDKVRPNLWTHRKDGFIWKSTEQIMILYKLHLNGTPVFWESSANNKLSF